MHNVVDDLKDGARRTVQREALASSRLGSKKRYLVMPTLALISGAVALLAFPFDGETDWWGLGIGGASLVYFAWSMILASRLAIVDTLFGGFDRVYLWHRAFSMLAVFTMWLHSQADNSIANPILPFGEDLAELGYELAELGEKIILVLILVSLFKFLPYQIWKLSHTFFIVPYAIGGFHFLTTENTFELTSPWGVYFSALLFAGALAFAHRLLIVDTGIRFRAAEVSDLEYYPNGSLRVRLSPMRFRPKRLTKPGKFVFVSFPEISKEVHPFSIAGIAPNGSLDLQIAPAGDWTTKLAEELAIGTEAKVSKPLGALDLQGHGEGRRTWLAAGSGVAPFLSGESVLLDGRRTTMYYSYRDESTAMGLELLREWARTHHNFELREIETSSMPRLSSAELSSSVIPGSYTVACGPEQFVSEIRRLAKRNRAEFEYELYDYRLAYDIFSPLAKIVERLGVKLPTKDTLQQFVESRKIRQSKD